MAYVNKESEKQKRNIPPAQFQVLLFDPGGQEKNTSEDFWTKHSAFHILIKHITILYKSKETKSISRCIENSAKSESEPFFQWPDDVNGPCSLIAEREIIYYKKFLSLFELHPKDSARELSSYLDFYRNN